MNGPSSTATIARGCTLTSAIECSPRTTEPTISPTRPRRRRTGDPQQAQTMTVEAWSRRILAELDDAVRADLAESLAVAIELHFGLTVTPSEAFGKRDAGGWCDGVSIIESGVILYRPTRSRRQNFTLMHELGHHLTDKSIDCLAWVADQPDPPKVLEQLCDQIAADLLIPDTLVEQLVGPRTIDASLVLDLYDNTGASRSACAIAASRRMPCDGSVVLIEDGAASVFFGAPRVTPARTAGATSNSLLATRSVGIHRRTRPSPGGRTRLVRTARSTSCPPHPPTAGPSLCSQRTTSSACRAFTSRRRLRTIAGTTRDLMPVRVLRQDAVVAVQPLQNVTVPTLRRLRMLPTRPQARPACTNCFAGVLRTFWWTACAISAARPPACSSRPSMRRRCAQADLTQRLQDSRPSSERPSTSHFQRSLSTQRRRRRLTLSARPHVTANVSARRRLAAAACGRRPVDGQRSSVHRTLHRMTPSWPPPSTPNGMYATGGVTTPRRRSGVAPADPYLSLSWRQVRRCERG